MKEKQDSIKNLMNGSIVVLIDMNAPKQHKQRYYYIFWSIATLAVVCGQIYVASSYKALANALKMSLL